MKSFVVIYSRLNWSFLIGNYDYSNYYEKLVRNFYIKAWRPDRDRGLERRRKTTRIS